MTSSSSLIAEPSTPYGQIIKDKTGSFEFYAGINKIVNYFARTSRGGFLFCSHDNSLVILEIIRMVIERSAKRDLNIKEFALDFEEIDSYLFKIRALVAEKPDGIIFSNLDELIALSDDRIIRDINLSRDILLGLEIPFLFCLSRENVAKFANQASDLYLRRDRGVIFFADPPGETKLDSFVELHTPEYHESVNFKSLQLKIALLEKQLNEAEARKYKPERIANEIALDLINIYVKASLLKESKKLFERFETYFNLRNDRNTLAIVGSYYYKHNHWDEALECYLKLKRIYEEAKDKRGMAIELHHIAAIYNIKGEFTESLNYLLKSKTLFEKLKMSIWIAHSTVLLGNVYARKYELDKALEHYFRGLEIYKKFTDIKQSGALVYFNIGLIYIKKRNLDEAFKYLAKSKELTELNGNILLNSRSLLNIGYVYLWKNQHKKAIKCFKDLKKIHAKIGNNRLGDINKMIAELEHKIKINESYVRCQPTSK